MNSAATTPTPHPHPWRGLRAYELQGEHQFVGREEEIAAVAALIRSESLVVLYGASGTGKTSLLNAGVFPTLLKEHFLPFRVRLDHPGAHPLADSVYAELEKAARQMQAEVPKVRTGATLWEHFNRAEADIWSGKNEVLTPIMVLDQFEEIFTLGQADENKRRRSAAFLEELSALIEMRAPAHVLDAARADPAVLKQYRFQSAPVRVVLSLREDFLPDLESLRTRFRGLQQNRFRLLPMDARQARAVIRLGSHLMVPEAEDAILDFASRNSAHFSSLDRLLEGYQDYFPGANAAPWQADETRKIFSPALLSLLLDELSRISEVEWEFANWLRSTDGTPAPQGADARRQRPLITPSLVQTQGDKIFDTFYERCITDVPDQAARFVEKRLVTPYGKFRESVAEETWNEELKAQGIAEPRAILAELEQRRLLQHSRGRVELLHDVLVAPVWRANERRSDEEKLTDANRAAAEARRKLLRLRITFAVFILLMVLSGAAVYHAWRSAETLEVRTERNANALLLVRNALNENYEDDAIAVSLTRMRAADIDALVATAQGLAQDGRLRAYGIVSRIIANRPPSEPILGLGGGAPGSPPFDQSKPSTHPMYPQTWTAISPYVEKPELTLSDLKRLHAELQRRTEKRAKTSNRDHYSP